MTDKITLEAALRVVRAHGMKVQEKPVKLRKDEVARIEAGLNANERRVVLVHNGKGLTVFSVASYHERKSSAAHKFKRKPLAEAVAEEQRQVAG